MRTAIDARTTSGERAGHCQLPVSSVLMVIDCLLPDSTTSSGTSSTTVLVGRLSDQGQYIMSQGQAGFQYHSSLSFNIMLCVRAGGAVVGVIAF